MFCHVCVFNIIWNLQTSIGRLFKMCAGQQKTNLENAYFFAKTKAQYWILSEKLYVFIITNERVS